MMDKKTANSNLFIIAHLLVLFLFSLFAAQGAIFFAHPLTAFLYYFILVLLPLFLYIWLGEKHSPWPVLGFTFKPLKGIAIGLLIGVMIGAAFFLSDHFLTLNGPKQSPMWYMALGAVFVGMAEETLFRGFVLPRMMAQMPFIRANIFSSLLFTALHVARLITGGVAEIPALALLFVISLWLGYLFKQTRSIWAVMLVHGLYNLAILLF